LALLTQTLRDWFAHCQKMTERREGLGMSMPAHILCCQLLFGGRSSGLYTPEEVYEAVRAVGSDVEGSPMVRTEIWHDYDTHIKLVGTKADMRKGRGTGLPVSGWILELTTAMSALQIEPATSLLEGSERWTSFDFERPSKPANRPY
jgi:hypothetical protein